MQSSSSQLNEEIIRHTDAYQPKPRRRILRPPPSLRGKFCRLRTQFLFKWHYNCVRFCSSPFANASVEYAIQDNRRPLSRRYQCVHEWRSGVTPSSGAIRWQWSRSTSRWHLCRLETSLLGRRSCNGTIFHHPPRCRHSQRAWPLLYLCAGKTALLLTLTASKFFFDVSCADILSRRSRHKRLHRGTQFGAIVSVHDGHTFQSTCLQIEHMSHGRHQLFECRRSDSHQGFGQPSLHIIRWVEKFLRFDQSGRFAWWRHRPFDFLIAHVVPPYKTTLQIRRLINKKYNTIQNHFHRITCALSASALSFTYRYLLTFSCELVQPSAF